MPQLGPIQVIVNPTAAYGKTAGRWPAIQAALRAQGLVFTATLTEQRGHASELARQAVAQGFALVVAVGGEGTIYEVVNGLMDATTTQPPNHPTAQPPNHPTTPLPALGILPCGTGGDFVRSLGLPKDPLAAIKHLVGDSTRTIDVGYLECAPLTGGDPVKRYFLNIAGLGFDGEVIQRVERSSKAAGGTIPYLTNLFVSLVTYRNKSVQVRYDGQTLSGRVNSVITANGRYFGGGMFIAPNASLDDGLFDLVILGDLTKPEVVANVPRLYKGTHITHPKVKVYQAQEVQVTAQERMLIQADGELVGQAPATFRVIPRALKVKV